MAADERAGWTSSRSSASRRQGRARLAPLARAGARAAGRRPPRDGEVPPDRPAAPPRARRALRHLRHPSGQRARYVDLGEAAPLDKLIGEFRAALSTPERLAARDLGRKLDEAPDAPGPREARQRHYLICSARRLPQPRPLCAPWWTSRATYLLERYTINYLASGRDLLVLGRDEPAAQPRPDHRRPRLRPAGRRRPRNPTDGAQRRSRDFRSTKYERLPGTATEAQPSSASSPTPQS